ncbi:Hypothetical protein PHPALM_10466 [Phytophthora palmivora]|uniref:Uncharacterized protein n=1 Tax=Phytophthora palmivora TaxID=4796 RepID=A0A2P4Y4M7_9STRA|nr:Hypothetical protein PHPALM_10466 [Phytophthora palmivora]
MDPQTRATHIVWMASVSYIGRTTAKNKARTHADQLAVKTWTHHFRSFNKMVDGLANISMDAELSKQILHSGLNSLRGSWRPVIVSLQGDTDHRVDITEGVGALNPGDGASRRAVMRVSHNKQPVQLLYMQWMERTLVRSLAY